jgi:hypothetical protein
VLQSYLVGREIDIYSNVNLRSTREFHWGFIGKKIVLPVFFVGLEFELRALHFHSRSCAT